MDTVTANPITHHIFLPLSPEARQLGLELDTMMKSASDISLSIPIDCQGSRIAVTSKDKKAFGNVELEDDWTLDTRNPRNWPISKKWAAVSVVRSSGRFYNWMLRYAVSLRDDRFQLIPSSPPLSAL
jgi:hypothetical protein